MTKRYDIIHLPDGFIYGITKEQRIEEGDYVYYQGCPEVRLVFKVQKITERSTHDKFPNGVCADGRDTNDKVIFTNNPSLGLPLLPDIEEGLTEDKAQKMIEEEGICANEREERIGYHMLHVGYKAASARKYTEEDLKKAYEAGITNIQNLQDFKIWSEFIKFLSPKPIAVEVEMITDWSKETRIYMEAYRDNLKDFNFNPKLKLNDNQVVVNKWIWNE